MSLYRGTPEITIPLYEVEGHTHSLPIRLRYHASGIKVNEAASWVGQNWALEAGGVISRTARGRPDERTRGFLDQRDEMVDFLDDHSWDIVNRFFDGGTYDESYDEGDHDYLGWVAGHAEDTEPDQFFFNVAGLSGQFLFNHDAQGDEQIVMTTRGASVRIEYDDVSGGEIQKWTLWGPGGTKYVFAQPEWSSPFMGGSLGMSAHISSWYLTEVHPPSESGDVIKLGYEEGSDWIEYSTGETQVVKDVLVGPYIDPDCNSSPASGMFVPNNHRYKPQYLDYIKSDRERIDFISVEDRKDLDGERRIKKIEVRGGLTLLKEIEFEHGYYTWNGNPTRLRLDAVYETAGDGSEEGARYEFSYNSGSLPDYESLGIDHWGFYNGSSDGLIPTVEVEQAGTTTTYSGNTGSREPSGYRSKMGILEKITYPTGGHTHFSYELHDYGDIAGDDIGSGQAGGLRIRKIESDPDDGSSPVVKRYEYERSDETSSGVLVAKPVYWNIQSNRKCKDPPYPNGPVDLIPCPLLDRTSSSFVALGTSSGGHIGYSRVTEYIQEGNTDSRIVHVFDAEGTPAQQPIWPRVPRPNVQWNHGQKIASYVYDGEDRLVRAINFDYATDSQEKYPEVYGLRASPDGQGVLPIDPDNSPDSGFFCVRNYVANTYSVQAGWRRLVSKTTTHYSEDGADPLVVSESYEYDEDTYQVTKITEVTSNELERTTRYTYAHERYPEMGMDGKHQLSQKYRTTVYGEGGVILKRTWTTWKKVANSFWLPEAEWVWTDQ